MKINHIGYWVESIDKSVNIFKMLGYQKESDIFYDESRDCYICFFAKPGILIKLIEPSSSSLFRDLLDEHKEQDFHICYETTKFEEYILQFKVKGYEVFERDEKTVLLSNKKEFLEIKKVS